MLFPSQVAFLTLAGLYAILLAAGEFSTALAIYAVPLLFLTSFWILNGSQWQLFGFLALATVETPLRSVHGASFIPYMSVVFLGILWLFRNPGTALRIALTPDFRFWTLLILWMVGHLPASYVERLSYAWIATMVGAIGFFGMTKTCLDRTRHLPDFIPSIAGPLGLAALLQVAGLMAYSRGPVDLIRAHLDRNAFGASFAPMLAILLLAGAHLRRSRPLAKMWGIRILIAGCLLAVAQTTSRSMTIFAFVIVVGCLVWLYRVSIGKVLGITAAVAAVVQLSGGFSSHPDPNEAGVSLTVSRFAMLGDSDRTMASRTSGRTALIEASFLMMFDNPLGVGPGRSPDHMPKYLFQTDLAKRNKLNPHNGFGRYAAEGGWVGLGLFVAWLGRFVAVGLNGLSVLRNRMTPTQAASLVAGLACTANFMGNEAQSSAMWLTLGILLHQRDPIGPPVATAPVASTRSLPLSTAPQRA